MSDSNQVVLKLQKELTYAGSLAAGNASTVLFTGENIRQVTQTTTSQTIRSDRQIQDVLRTSIGVEGSIDFELIFEDQAMESLLENALQQTGVLGNDVTLWTATNATFSDVASSSYDDASITTVGTEFATTTPGDWLYFQNTAAGANDGLRRVTGVITGDQICLVSQELSDSVSDNCDCYKLDKIANGTTLKSMVLEKEFSDLGSDFVSFPGCVIENLTLNFALGSVITGSVGFSGQKELSDTTTALSTLDAAGGNAIMSTIDGVTALFEGQVKGNLGDPDDDGGNVAALTKVTDFSFTVTNNVRNKEQFGTLGAFDAGLGTVGVEGSLTVHLDATSDTTFDKFLNHTTSSLAIQVTDSAGDVFVFDMPAVKFTAGERIASGINTDVFMTLGFTAFREGELSDDNSTGGPAIGDTISIHKYTA